MIVVSAVFTAVLAAVGYLAWRTASGTTGPWFTAAVSSQVYSVTLLASTILAVGVALVAALHVAAVRHDLMFLNRRIAAIRSAWSDELPSPDSHAIEDELDEILGTMERSLTTTLVEVRPDIPPPGALPAAATKESVRRLMRELVRERISLRETIIRVRIAVVGPVVASILFGAIAAAMLPAVGGFADTQFVLNTGLILFLSYGWPFLVGWAVVAIALSRSIEAW